MARLFFLAGESRLLHRLTVSLAVLPTSMDTTLRERTNVTPRRC
jgi:hypothetical protein